MNRSRNFIFLLVLLLAAVQLVTAAEMEQACKEEKAGKASLSYYKTNFLQRFRLVTNRCLPTICFNFHFIQSGSRTASVRAKLTHS